MQDDTEPSPGPDATWEQRQKHAGFFQTQVGLMQQAAIGSQAAAALVVTLGTATAKFSGIAAGQDWTALFLAVMAWLLLVVLLTGSFGEAARRIERAYEQDHRRLFPGTDPYRLESFLLRRS